MECDTFVPSWLKTPPRNARDIIENAEKNRPGGTNTKPSLRRMETEGPSSSPAPEPARDGDAPTSETTREDLERRLRLSESVALELERALEGKCRSLDESTRAAESLRRELRAARAANEADGSFPAAAMDDPPWGPSSESMWYPKQCMPSGFLPPER